jgi:UDP-N-acetylmuramoylalanine--D-glutamate ligase
MSGHENRGSLDLRGRHILVVGMAREGMALAHFLSRQGAHVVVTDLKPVTAFEDEVSSLSRAGVELALGGHPPELLDRCEIVFVSPGVPFDSGFLNLAREKGVPLSTESRLFCHLCPAPVVAITGSSGKTTTTTLLGEMVKADGRDVWVGGNIGQPLIGSVESIPAGAWVIMELSSFQLEYFHPSANSHVLDCSSEGARQVDPMWIPLLSGWSPKVGAVLNVTPNHLDRHESMDAYVHAKRALVQYRVPSDVVVMGWDNAVTRHLGEDAAGRVRWFSRDTEVADGACLKRRGDETWVSLRSPAGLAQRTQQEDLICRTADIRLRGAHNVSNVLAACTIAQSIGVSMAAMRQVITSFSGVPHRLEWVGRVGGVDYYNDSIATTPERMQAALRAFREPVVLLAGGRDKHLPWAEAVQLMMERARQVILFGEAADLIARQLSEAIASAASETPPGMHRCDTLEQAVTLAAEHAEAGDVVLLSPGCASFDQFRDFTERGERFRQFVQGMTA